MALLGPAVLMIIAGLSVPTKGTAALLLLAVGTLWGVFSTISFEKSEFLIADGRLQIGVGFPWRRHYEVALDAIEGVHVYQPSLGKVLDFGKITIIERGKKRHVFRLVKAPFELSDAIYERRQG